MILPVKNELSPQEVILSLGSEMMSRFLVCETVFTIELVEYLDGVLLSLV
jgi:hypothetical protein